jgi:NAD(P)-dependent dehydrogenase (short-subunit alcohol dehydrogenase family)
MSINLKGVYFSVQKVSSLMSSGGAVVLCSSIGAVRSWPGATAWCHCVQRKQSRGECAGPRHCR